MRNLFDESLLASLEANPCVFYFDGPLEDMTSIQREMAALQSRADNQRRQLTSSETAEMESLYARFTVAEARLTIEDQTNGPTRARAEAASRSAGRQTNSGQPGNARQEMSRSNDGGSPVTMADVINNERIREVAEGRINHSGQIPLPGLRAILREIRNTLTGEPPSDSPATTTEFEVHPARLDRFGNDPRWALSLFGALPIFPMSTNELEFPLLTGEESEADYQTHEGSTKQEIDLPSEIQSAKVYTFAAWMRASKQVLADVLLLQTQIQSLLRYKVLKKIERELVNGTTKINGLLNLASVFSSDFAAPVDKIGDAASNLATAGWNPDLVVLSPNTLFRIRSERTTDEGGHQYVGGNWNDPNGSLWGLRRAITPAIADDTAIILDSSAVAVLDRMQASLTVETGGHENTVRNLVTILAEARVGMACFSPAAIKKVDLSEE